MFMEPYAIRKYIPEDFAALRLYPVLEQAHARVSKTPVRHPLANLWLLHTFLITTEI